MQYNSIGFLVFVLCVFFVFYLTPKKFRWIVLLLSSAVFYAIAGLGYLIFIGITILSTYVIARLIGREYVHQKEALKSEGLSREDKKRIKAHYKVNRRWFVGLDLLINVGLLAFLKYFNFFSQNISSLLKTFGLENEPVFLNLILPLGISFYTFQTLGYIIDCYRGKYEPEKNIAHFALFVSFFPHIIQGPIARYDQLAPQFFQKISFDWKQFTFGLELVLWGVIKKVMIADRLNILVDQVYGSYGSQSGFALFMATVAYSIQIYCDFSGCMDIGRGVAQALGISLVKNFDHPYFSKNMPEFWRRWHISLGNWFKDYVFYPISVSKFSQNLNKGARKHFGGEAGRIIAGAIPIYSVWVLTGIWHGSQWTFVMWGVYHGTLILFNLIFTPLCDKINDKLHINTKSFPWRLWQMTRVFLLCCVGRVFFCAGSVRASFEVIGKFFTDFHMISDISSKSFLNWGLGGKDLIVAALSVVLLWVIDVCQEKGSVREKISGWNIVIRWTLIYAALFAVIIFGIYGPGYDASAFIYNQF